MLKHETIYLLGTCIGVALQICNMEIPQIQWLSVIMRQTRNQVQYLQHPTMVQYLFDTQSPLWIYYQHVSY